MNWDSFYMSVRTKGHHMLLSLISFLPPQDAPGIIRGEVICSQGENSPSFLDLDQLLT